MITTADLIDICELYYTQSFVNYVRCVHDANRWCVKNLFSHRCSMYALSARLILEGVY